MPVRSFSESDALRAEFHAGGAVATRHLTCAEKTLKLERRSEKFMKEAQPWRFVLGLDCFFFLVMGSQFFLRPRQTVSAHAQLCSLVGAESPDWVTQQSETSLLYMRILGVLLLCWMVPCIRAIATCDVGYAVCHGWMRLLGSVLFALLVIGGKNQSRVLVPFLLHSMWVSATLLNTGPHSFYTGLKKLVAGQSHTPTVT